MENLSIISKLKEKNIKIWLEGDKLRYKAPEGAMTQELMNELKEKKAEIISFLKDIEENNIVPVSRDKAIPLSFPQESLWFLDRYEGGKSPAYNIPLAFRLKGDLNIKALEYSINSIIKRHETLRTVFKRNEDNAVQEIIPSYEINLEPLLIGADKIYEIISKKAVEPFELEKGPLFKAELFKPEDNHYVLFINIHHIISDGWSGGILIKELNEFYNSYITGKKPDLPELTVHYCDYSWWERKKRNKDKDIKYWRNKLKNVTDLDFPTDHIRPPVKTYNGNKYYFFLDKENTDKLNKLARDENGTLFMVLLSAFNVLLARYCNKDDIVIGSPISGRERSEVENLIGFFVNMLVLRNDLSGNPAFRDLLRRVKNTCLEAYSHQDLHFNQLVDLINVPRDPGRTRVFQIVFALQKSQDKSGLLFPGITAEEIKFECNLAKFDITVSFSETPSGLDCEIEYNTDLFSEDRIRKMALHFSNLLKGIGKNPDEHIEKLPLLSEEEYKKIVYDWNHTSKPFKVEKTIHQIFEEQAEKYKDHIAVTFEGKDLTYKELNEKSNQVAHMIRELHRKIYGEEMKSDTLIGICVDRNIEMVIGILGILKSGGAYVPLDPRYPENRLRFMAEDAQCKIILTEQTFIEQLLFMTEGDFGIISLDAGWPIVSKRPNNNPLNINKPDDLAYVIYTSGSTGKPKGALLQHYNVIRLFKATEDLYDFTENDVWTCFHSYAFDFSVWEIWGPLLTGGRLVVVPYFTTRDPEEFYKLLNREKVTVLNQTPSAFYHLMEVDERSGMKNTSLRYVTYGGEALDINKLKVWWDKYDHTFPQLVNMYGITETTVHSTYHKLCPSDLGRKHVYSPIGKRLSDLTFYILDKDLNPVPLSVPGELYIGGDGLARGYFNRPELTRDRFISNPFATEEDKGQSYNTVLYKTGDLVRWLPDSSLEYIGRTDFQVKIRGFRIELGEIETVLGNHPSISQCIVLAKDLDGQTCLVAYYAVKKGEKEVTVTELREHLGKEVADYMIPSVFIEMDTLPLTENGKIDRKALPEPKTAHIISQAEYVPPRTKEERILAQIWKQIFNLHRVGIYDNFFTLGGNSLLSLQIIYKAREFGLHLTPKQMFVSPTISGLAKEIRKSSEIIAQQGLVTGECNLTPIQKWFFEQDFKEKNHFNQAVLLKLNNKFHSEEIKNIFEILIKHHDVFRLRYGRMENGEWKQYFSEDNNAFQIPIREFDLSEVHEKELDNFIPEKCTEVQRSLNIEQGPLISLGLFNGHPDGQQRLLIVIHNLLIGGVSWAILLEDFKKIYFGQSLPPKSSSFKDWGKALKDYSEREILKKEYPFWEKLVREIQPLPVDMNGENPLIKDTRSHTILIDRDITTDFLDIPYSNNILMPILSTAFYRWSGQKDLFLYMEGHGREESIEGVDISRTIGCFTNLYPIHLHLEDNKDLSEIIKSINEQMELIPDNGIGYGILRYLTGDEKSLELKKADSISLCYNYLGKMESSVNKDEVFMPADESDGQNESPENKMTHLITINGIIEKGILKFVFDYSCKHYREKTIIRLSEFLKEVLKDMVFYIKNLKTEGKDISFLEIKYERKPLVYEPVVSFNEEGTYEPLFFIHPGQGGAETYFHFSGLLDKNQPFYSIESYNLYSEKPLLTSIEELGKLYLEYIRKIKPHGPYFLGGWCLGGLISYEIARQLISIGEKTEIIYFLDTFMYNDYEKDLILNFANKSLLEEFLKSDPLYYKFPEQYRDRLLDASVQEYRSLHNYKVTSYDGEVIFFKANLEQPVPPDGNPEVIKISKKLNDSIIPKKDNGWGEYIKNLTIIQIEANHHSMMEGDNIKTIAEFIQKDIIRRSRVKK